MRRGNKEIGLTLPSPFGRGAGGEGFRSYRGLNTDSTSQFMLRIVCPFSHRQVVILSLFSGIIWLERYRYFWSGMGRAPLIKPTVHAQMRPDRRRGYEELRSQENRTSDRL